MKIGINLLQYTDVQGIEVFARNLLTALVDQRHDDEFIFFVNQKSAKIFDFSKSNVRYVVKNFKKLSRFNLIFYQQLTLPKILHKEKIDILFCPSVAAPLNYHKKIITIHDLASKRFSEEAGLFSRLYLNLLFYTAKHNSLGITTVSEFSKDEINKILRISKENIKVISEGVPELPPVSESEIRETLSNFNLQSKKYFFYISNLRPRKNVPGLLASWEIFSKEHPGYQLVIAGKKHKYSSNNPTVSFIGQISDKEKVCLYKEALAFVFPSLYEGFGLPVLEAQFLGTPVLASSSSSLPEISGEAALLFNPSEPTEIAQAMEKISMDSNKRRELIDMGYNNVKRFSWTDSAKRLDGFIGKISKGL